MRIINERKIKKLEKELHKMAREKAVKFVDESVADLAASRIIQKFGEDMLMLRASDWKLEHGKPETFEERKKAAEYICGKKYSEFLAKNPDEVKELLEAYLECITIRLSGRTMKEASYEN
jgi:hypothetical protein